MTDLNFWRTVALWAAACGQTFFILMYATLPWWRSYLGRSLFLKALSFAVILDFAVLARMVEWSKEDAVFVTLYSLMAIGIWGQNVSFIRTSRRKDFPDD